MQRDDFENVFIIGKEKKNFKVVFKTTVVRNKVLSYARQNKPKDIFFAEFLTTYRSRLFYETRQLKRRFPDKIVSVYVRQGTVYCKLMESNHPYLRISKIDDVTALLKSFTTENSDNASNSE